MSEVKIYIDSKIADVSPDGVNLVLTYAIKQKEGIETNTGTRSEYAFEFPATKQNDEIFSRFFDVGEVTINKQIFLDARIEIDGMTFFTGKCQLQSANLTKDFYYWKGDKYKVAFFGNNVDWIIQLKDKYLSDYDFGTHTYTRNLIWTLYWGQIYPLGFTFKYILIKWKDWDVFQQVDPLESTPALFIKSIVDNIFASIGYTINSAFMSTTWFEKLVMPIPLPERFGDDFDAAYTRIEAEETIVGFSAFSGTFISSTQTLAPTVGANPYNTGTGIYTAPFDGFYLVEFEFTVTNPAPAYGMVFNFIINGIPPSVPTWGQIVISPPLPYTTDNVFKGEYVYQLSAGDTIQIGMVFQGTGDISAKLRITGETEIKDGSLIDFRYIVNKSWKSIDFLKGLAHAFNLVFETNTNTRIVTIEPADMYVEEDRNPNIRRLNEGFYYTTLGQTTEKTPFIDLAKEGELESLIDFSSLFRLSWKYDSADPTVEALNGTNKDVLGLFESRFRYSANRFKDGETLIENPFFAATLMIADFEVISTPYEKTPMIPFIWKDNYLDAATSTSQEKNINVLPRILVSEFPFLPYNGNIRVFTGSIVQDLPCPLSYMIDYNDSDGYQMSLSFNNYQVSGREIKGLMERFYLKNLIRLQTGKRLQTFMFWDAVLLQNLTFRKKIRIHGDEYILQEINSFNVGQRSSTKTYLLYDGKGNGTEDSQIEDSEIKGLLITEALS
jgi:hypothetical protein